MAERRSIEILRDVEAKLDIVHETIEELKRHVISKPVSLSNDWAAEENSGEWTKQGLKIKLSRNFIDTYIPSIKWFLIGMIGWGAGWLSKIAHAWMSK